MLGSFFKNWFSNSGNVKADFSPLITDLHSHLIFGIDDGAGTAEDSIALAKELVSLGFSKAITTPHVISDSYKNNTEIILAGLEVLRKNLEIHNIGLKVEASAEYYIDEAFEELVASSDLLSFGGEKRYVLFETSYVSKPLSLQTILFEMKMKGYMPVMAHPERYTFFWNAPFSEIEELYGCDIKFQINTSSFAGNNGERANKIARKLLEADMIDFLGTDLHRVRQAAPVREAFMGDKNLRNLIQSGRLLNAHL